VRVAAIVVNWRQSQLTSRAVRSLEAQQGLGAATLRIVVVDNGSGDGSAAELADRHPEHLVLPLATNGGFAAGVNAGIRAADAEGAADTYVLLNNDAVAEPGAVAALVEELAGHPDAAAVTARIVLAASPDGVERLNSTGNELTRTGNGRDRDWLRPVADDDRPAGEVAGFSGGAAALRAEALRAVGGFDESLFMYYEDSDLSWRLRRAGWSIRYSPAATVRHDHAASSGTGSDLFRFYNDRNRIVISLRHLPARVVLRAIARTVVRAGRATVQGLRRADARHEAARTWRAVGSALVAAPTALALRRRLDRTAVVPRSALAATLVAD
jgi:GT2 family glycosyltransferase